MVGEQYGNSTGFGPSPPLQAPRIVVYTSPDMATWSNRGLAFTNWSTYPYGTFFTPWVIFNERTQMFVMWFNAYLHGCCEGAWGVATSKDGVKYEVLSFNVSGYWGSNVDGNALFVDDDQTAYLCYTSMSSGFSSSSFFSFLYSISSTHGSIITQHTCTLHPEQRSSCGPLHLVWRARSGVRHKHIRTTC